MATEPSQPLPAPEIVRSTADEQLRFESEPADYAAFLRDEADQDGENA